MPNPFDDEAAEFCVLVNPEGQFSLWLPFLETPAGWRVVRSGGTRAACLSFIETSWPDLRPTTLVDADGERIESAALARSNG